MTPAAENPKKASRMPEQSLSQMPRKKKSIVKGMNGAPTNGSGKKWKRIPRGDYDDKIKSLRDASALAMTEDLHPI